MELSEFDLLTLQRARRVLESPGLAARLSNIIGAPVEAGVRSLPFSVQELIVRATRSSLQAGLRAMIATMDCEPGKPGDPSAYQLVSSLSGAASGFFGLAALPVELPLTTLMMLRSIAEHAREQGEDLAQPEVQLACLEVLALGGRSRADDAAEAGYYASRIGLAQSINSAASYLSRHGFARKVAGPVANFISRVAARFSVTVTESMLAKAVPVIGAASGATVNALFMRHFQDMAWAHFTVRRLERKYGAKLIQRTYEALAASDLPPRQLRAGA
ncbi:MAG TPA: EcsC family protein [Polyangiales bacterium]|nr:EcsC family protein [Polyangiales bacterium]